jgi:hypothetical protein
LFPKPLTLFGQERSPARQRRRLINMATSKVWGTWDRRNPRPSARRSGAHPAHTPRRPDDTATPSPGGHGISNLLSCCLDAAAHAQCAWGVGPADAETAARQTGCESHVGHHDASSGIVGRFFKKIPLFTTGIIKHINSFLCHVS